MEVESTNCESIKPIVEKYFGDYTDQALFVSFKESGCQNIRSYKMNKNGTYDYCPFQINNEPSVLHDLDKCVKRAWEKFKLYKHWGQWYAVCKPDRTPKYQGIKCN
jgi:hypothetical protein